VFDMPMSNISGLFCGVFDSLMSRLLYYTCYQIPAFSRVWSVELDKKDGIIYSHKQHNNQDHKAGNWSQVHINQDHTRENAGIW
jgi:hypothetical protein